MFNWENVLSNVNGGGPIPPRRVEKSLVEWKKILTSEQFYVTRQKGTELPHTSQLVIPQQYNLSLSLLLLF
jgi:peptide-methionine (R)-S-oxide reductase